MPRFTSSRLGVQIHVADSAVTLNELVDLKMLPAWANESASAERYAHVEGGEEPRQRERGQFADRRKPRSPRPDGRGGRGPDRGRKARPGGRDFKKRRGDEQHPRAEPKPERPPPKIEVGFLPRVPVLENVVAQIKEGSVAYSLFALARLFLAKPERYEVRLTASTESPLFQLGEHGAVASDREFLERNAFRLAQAEFYKVEVTETEPIKGNFTSVARDRLSGTVLGPTNHHDYQKRLRGLYEQRFSRRMNFPDYQRQIEIVSDQQLVEQWKDEARKITTYTTLDPEKPVTFSSGTEVQRHFKENYVANLVQQVAEVPIDGVTSRKLGDRALYRVVENEWSRENGSPSHMMQELATQFRQSGLQVFRHRRGMLFVSAIRPRPLTAGETSVSVSVQSILETVAAQPRINRKDLADKVLANTPAEAVEAAKLSLASDLRWLIGEGHVIEFNDGSLDLPRLKKQTGEVDAGTAANADGAKDQVNSVEESGPKEVDHTKEIVAAAVTPEDPNEKAPDTVASPAQTASMNAPEAEIGGS